MDDRISFRAAYERFPATIKGAFVLRAADRDPHQVAISGARVVELSGGGGRPIELQTVTQDVAPNLDLFVPFEVPTTDLGPGWYQLVCDVVVDAVAGEERPGDPFPIAWPRGSVRRGTVDVGKAVAAGAGKLRIEHVECSGDSIKVSYTAEEPATIKLTADGASVAVITRAFDEETGAGRVVAYPVLKSQRRLGIDVKGAATPVEVKLP
jgi:hypothetical protein